MKHIFYTCTEFIDWWTSESVAEVTAYLSFEGVLGDFTIIKSKVSLLNYDLMAKSKIQGSYPSCPFMGTTVYSRHTAKSSRVYMIK